MLASTGLVLRCFPSCHMSIHIKFVIIVWCFRIRRCSLTSTRCDARQASRRASSPRSQCRPQAYPAQWSPTQDIWLCRPLTRKLLPVYRTQSPLTVQATGSPFAMVTHTGHLDAKVVCVYLRTHPVCPKCRPQTFLEKGLPIGVVVQGTLTPLPCRLFSEKRHAQKSGKTSDALRCNFIISHVGVLSADTSGSN